MMDNAHRSAKISKLYPDKRYLICVFALGNWSSRKDFPPPPPPLHHFRIPDNYSHDDWEIYNDIMLPLLSDSHTSKCIEVMTLGPPDVLHGGLESSPDQGQGVQSILTRRLGLIIGCCMGVIVFIVLVSVLGYLKVKKQRAAVKRDQQPIPPEYLSYRHFSIQSGEAGAHAHGTHPHFITSLNSTGTLN